MKDILAKNKTLNLTPECKIQEWSKIIFEILKSGRHVCLVGDTETTGKYPYGNKNDRDIKDRLLEVGFIAYHYEPSKGIKEPIKDSDGNIIFLHEYVNPFREDPTILSKYNSIRNIPMETVYIHGITEDFLNCKSGLYDSNMNKTNYSLSRPAPTFSVVKGYIEELLSLRMFDQFVGRIFFCAHNASFDMGFMDAEWGKTELFDEEHMAISTFESHVAVLCTLELSKQIYPSRDLLSKLIKPERQQAIDKANEESTQRLFALRNRGFKDYFAKPIKSGNSLEFLRYYYGLHEMERDMHGALIDSVVLAAVYNAMLNDPMYIKLISKDSDYEFAESRLDTSSVKVL
ncbi:hypothetical protein QTV43_000200 [Vibrio vulnificus]|nr:hypothetical protein [Vibrio vulnificus]